MSRKVEAMADAAAELYGKIARTHENLMKLGSAKITVGAVEARLQLLERYWSKFDALSDELLDHLDQISGLDYVKLDIPAMAEESYLLNKGSLLDLLSSLKEKAAATPSSAETETSARVPRITLPRSYRTSRGNMRTGQLSAICFSRS
ncbi:Peptidase aspartic putative domain-containing protein [Camponotus japonicus]